MYLSPRRMKEMTKRESCLVYGKGHLIDQCKEFMEKKEKQFLLKENYVLDAIHHWLRIIMPRAVSNDWYAGCVLSFTQLECVTMWKGKLIKIMIIQKVENREQIQSNALKWMKNSRLKLSLCAL